LPKVQIFERKNFTFISADFLRLSLGFFVEEIQRGKREIEKILIELNIVPVNTRPGFVTV